MKLVAMILLLSMAAFAVTVEPLPQSEFADTEVSTNIAFVVERSWDVKAHSGWKSVDDGQSWWWCVSELGVRPIGVEDTGRMGTDHE